MITDDVPTGELYRRSRIQASTHALHALWILDILVVVVLEDCSRIPSNRELRMGRMAEKEELQVWACHPVTWVPDVMEIEVECSCCIWKERETASQFPPSLPCLPHVVRSMIEVIKTRLVVIRTHGCFPPRPHTR